MRSKLPPPYLWILLALPRCATFEQSSRNAGSDGGNSGSSGGSLVLGSAGSFGGVSGPNPVGSSAGQQHSVGSSDSGANNSGGVSAAGAAGLNAGSAGEGGKSLAGETGGAGVAGAPASGASAGGESSVNPCDHNNWTASASESSLLMPNYDPPSYAIDGAAGTRWSSGMPPTGGEWFLVDLGAKATHLTRVVLDTASSTGDIPPAYRLELSLDNAKYTQVATGVGADVTTINFADAPARYIKLTQTRVSTATQGHWWSIHEFTLTCTP